MYTNGDDENTYELKMEPRKMLVNWKKDVIV